MTTILRGIIRHFENRLFELAMAVAMIALGLHLLIWPAALGASAFRFMVETLPPQFVSSVFFAFGMLRIAALIANGRWPVHGPKLRALGCLAGGCMWAQMDIALIALIPKVGSPPSPGIPVYAVLTIFELISFYRALAGANGRSPAGRL